MHVNDVPHGDVPQVSLGTAQPATEAIAAPERPFLWALAPARAVLKP
jgi:hypothetical protein